jgi:aminoglycoside phosphotransferase (APT) family kinase protein
MDGAGEPTRAGEDGWRARVVRRRRLPGGRNAQVYAVDFDGRPACLKVFAADDRDHAAREWTALRYLKRVSYPLAARPIHYDPSPPAILMDLLPGRALAGAVLSRQQLTALGQAVDGLHALPVEGAGLAEAAATAASMLARVRRAVVDASALSTGFILDCQRWLGTSHAEALSQPGRPVFGKGDAGVGNCLWDGTTLRLVDFEYAGISDRPFDLAELVEHVEARATAGTSWQAFLGERQLDADELARLTAARKLLAIFWSLRLSAEPAEVREAQIDRASRLLTSDD